MAKNNAKKNLNPNKTKYYIRGIWAVTIIAALALIVIGITCYWTINIVSQYQELGAGLNPRASATPSPSTSPFDETADWRNYTNTQYGFSLQFSDSWSGYKVIPWSSVGSSLSGATEAFYVVLPTTDADAQNKAIFPEGEGEMFSLFWFPLNYLNQDPTTGNWSGIDPETKLTVTYNKEQYIAQNDKYVIMSYIGGSYNYIPKDKINEAAQITNILSTFKFL